MNAENRNVTALSAHGLRKAFGRTVVLQGVDVAIQRHKVTAFIGPNGAGKTTLFHTISGDLSADAGEVWLEDRNVTNMPSWQLARMGLGKMFQDVRIFESLSPVENISLALQNPTQWSPFMAIDFVLNTRKRQWLHERATDLLEKVGLTGDLAAPAGMLSYGNQKMLALGRMLARGFPTLLLDEPSTGLSPTMTHRLAELIREHVQKGCTVALIEHNIDFVRFVADVLYVLRDGSVAAHGMPSDVLRREDVQDLCVGL